MKQDYYEILGVSRDADTARIKASYRELALRYHPDRNIDNPAAADKMKLVNEAYAVLSDPRKKQDYDMLRRQHGAGNAAHRFRQQYAQEDIFAGTDIQRVFDEIAKSFGFRGFDDIFKEFYVNNHKRHDVNSSGFHGRGVFFFGTFGPGRFPAHFKRLGTVGRLAKFLIGAAGGGLLPRNGNDLSDTIRLQPDLARKGGPYAYFHRWRSKKLVVKIPPGVRHGQRIRLPGMGGAGSGGGADGDLYLKIILNRSLIDRLRDYLPI